MLQKILKKNTFADLHSNQKHKNRKLHKQHNRNNNMNTIIFGQLSPEKPNVGKPVQKMMVLYLSSEMESTFTRVLMSKVNLAYTSLNFLELSEEFQTLRVSSYTLCVIQRENSAQSFPGLRNSAWRGSCCRSAHHSLHPPDFCFSDN